MSLRRGGIETERLAGFGLLVLTLAFAAGGMAIRHGVAIGFPRALVASAIPWAVSTVAAGGNEDAAHAVAGSATRFARAFWADDDAIAPETMTPAVASALTPGRIANLRAQLNEAYGKVVRIDPAWHEDSVGGFERFRVPLVFERGALDMRVVLDDENRVAGMFLVEPIAPPTEDEVAPALTLLRHRNEVDPSRVYLLGHSLGGTLAPRIAAVVPTTWTPYSGPETGLPARPTTTVPDR